MVKTTRKSIVFMAMVSAIVAYGDTYTVKSGTTDWTLPGSYTTSGGTDATVVPGASDVVALPANASFSVTAGSESFNVISNFYRVSPASGSSLTIYVGEGVAAALGCAITSYGESNFDYHRGNVIKTGAGTLELICQARIVKSSGQYYDYCTCFTVQEGAIRFRQSDASGSNYYGALDVAEGATIYASNYSAGNGNFCPSEIHGAGLITNAISKSSTFYLMTSPGNQSDFSGRIDGPFSGMFSGPVYLTGTNSTFSGNITAFMSGSKFNAMAGITAVQSFGTKGKPSSIGAGSLIYVGDHGGGYLYLGAGETTDKSVYIRGTDDNSPSLFDGGVTGGVVFAGSAWGPAATDKFWSQKVLLTGSNATACTVQSPINGWKVNGTNCAFQIKKTGTGTWNLTSTNSTNGGFVSVEEGTLGFLSLREAGTACSLGTALAPMKWVSGAYDAANLLDYAISLGTDSTEGTLEYLGTNRNASTTRPLVVAGVGRILNDDASGAVHIGGISALGDGKARTLVLDGKSTSEDNVAEDISDGEGVLSVEKRGSGTWRLAGDTAFSGPLSVKEGTLIVENGAGLPFNWFRFTVRGTWGSYQSQLQELALYDASGVRQNIGLAYDQPPQNASTARITSGYTVPLPEGRADYGISQYFNSDGRDLACLFDATNTAAGWTAFLGGMVVPTETNEASWMPIVMHLTNGTPEIAACDLAIPGGVSSNTEIRVWALEGSRDGIAWTTLTNITYETGPTPTGNPKWYSDRAETYDGAAVRPGKGYLFGGADTNSYDVLVNAASVSVASGATLRAKGAVTLTSVSIDCADAGSIEGFSFAESGTLSISNAPGNVDFSIVLPDSTGLDNVESWNLVMAGTDVGGRIVEVHGNTLNLLRKGCIIILR